MNADWMKISKMTEEEARAQFEAIRWPNGIICPKCGSDKGAWQMKTERLGLYKCKECTRKFTVTMGTIFEDSHIPLNKWLMGIYLMNASKKGISAHQLHRMLDITYKAAWFMAHRIRYAMDEKPLGQLLGIVEADETYVGGKEHNKHMNKRLHVQHHQKGKIPVFALVERGGDLRAQKQAVISGKTIKGIIRQHVSPNTRIMTDDSSVYLGIEKEYALHETINHRAREYVRGDVYTNTVEGWFALLKRGVMGTFHHVSEQHLDRYVKEFEFRYNNRKVSDAERAKNAMRGVEGKRLVYKDTIKKD